MNKNSVHYSRKTHTKAALTTLFACTLCAGSMSGFFEQVVGATAAYVTGKKTLGTCHMLKNSSPYIREAACFGFGLAAYHIAVLIHELGHAIAAQSLFTTRGNTTIDIGSAGSENSNTKPWASFSLGKIDIRIQELLPTGGVTQPTVQKTEFLNRDNWWKKVVIYAAGPLTETAAYVAAHLATNGILHASGSPWRLPFSKTITAITLAQLLPCFGDGMQIVHTLKERFWDK